MLRNSPIGSCTGRTATRAARPASTTAAPVCHRRASWWTSPTGPSTKDAPCSPGTVPISCAASRFTRTAPSSIAWATSSSRTRAFFVYPTRRTGCTTWATIKPRATTSIPVPEAAPALLPQTRYSGKAWSRYATMPAAPCARSCYTQSIWATDAPFPNAAGRCWQRGP